MPIKKLSHIICVALLLLLIVMGGCGKKENEKIKIGVSISNFDDPFIINMVEAMKIYAQETYGNEVEVVFTDAKGNATIQLGQVENFIAQGMNSVVIIPVENEATDPMTKICLDNGIKVVYLNRKPNNLPEGTFYVGSEEIKAGELQMEYIAEKLNEKGNIVILMGKLENEGAIKRTEGVKKIAAKYPGIKVIKEQTGQWHRALGMQIMENWLSAGNKIDAVISNNDEMALGALMAIEARGKLGEILVAGIDATADALNAMDKGKLDVTVFQNGIMQGQTAIDAAYKTSKGETQDQFVWIPFKLITKENYKELMK